jgi:hypothetical protein
VGPRTGLDAVEKRKFLHRRDFNSNSSVGGIRYTDCAIPAPYVQDEF